MSRPPRRYALVAGGGTAGHLVPALAVARVLEERHGRGSVELVGARRGLEGRDGAVAGELPITLLPGRGVVRRLDPAGLRANVGALTGLAGALAMAFALVWRCRPAVVVSVGGFASVPTAVAAILLGVPVVVVNVDAVPGLANRLVGRVARAAAVAAPGTRLPRARSTGAPVRAEVASLAGAGVGGPRPEARRALGVPEGRTVVAVVGGSLGAKRINEAALALAREWAGRDDLALYHIVGRRDYDWVCTEAARQGQATDGAVPCPAGAGGERPAGTAPPGAGAGGRQGTVEGTAAGGAGGAAGGLWLRHVPYEERMDLVYQAADVVVGRAGAMTVAELSVVGVPAVLVPLPGAPGDHQTANARVLAAAGAAELVPDAECDGARLAHVLGPLVADADRRRAMAAAAAGLGRPEAAEAAATLAEAHAKVRGAR